MNKAVFILVPRMMAVASLMVLEWICFLRKERNFVKTTLDVEINSGAPNEKIVQNHLNIALLNVF